MWKFHYRGLRRSKRFPCCLSLFHFQTPNGIGDCSHVIHAGSYTTDYDRENSSIKDYEKTTPHLYAPLNSGSQFCEPVGVRWSAGQCNDFQAEDDCNDPLNLRYDVSLDISMHDIDINTMQRSYQLLQIDGRGGVGHRRDFSKPQMELEISSPFSSVDSRENYGKIFPISAWCAGIHGQMYIFHTICGFFI